MPSMGAGGTVPAISNAGRQGFVPHFNRSRLNASLSKLKSAARQYDKNMNRLVQKNNDQLRELERQLSSLRRLRGVRPSIVIQHELQAAFCHGEAGFLVRQGEWYAMNSEEQQHLRTWAEQRDMELIVVDDYGDELYRL